MRREAFGNYLGLADKAIATELAGQGQDAVNAVAVELYPAGARVALVAKSDAVKNAAVALRDALIVDPSESSKTHEVLQQEYERAHAMFLDVAIDELGE